MDEDFVWLHDYHLLVLPSLLRKRFNRIRLGLFLHSPFPSSEIFRTFPRREEILRSLLNADLLGMVLHLQHASLGRPLYVAIQTLEAPPSLAKARGCGHCQSVSAPSVVDGASSRQTLCYVPMHSRSLCADSCTHQRRDGQVLPGT